MRLSRKKSITWRKSLRLKSVKQRYVQINAKLKLLFPMGIYPKINYILHLFLKYQIGLIFAYTFLYLIFIHAVWFSPGKIGSAKKNYTC